MADILAFGAHPDDTEIGAGGTLARHCRLGYEVVICDLSLGELSSNGTPEERLRESREAARILGVTVREVLGLQDRALSPTPERVRVVAEAVRRWRPRVVLAPFGKDRHPDHASAEVLVREGVFSAGLARYSAAGEPHRAARLAFYFVNSGPEPSFVVDVSEVYEVKRAALAAYASQFGPLPGGPARPGPAPEQASRPGSSADRPTPLRQGYVQWVELRDSWYGSLVGAVRAEGFRWDGVARLGDLVRDL